MNMAIKLIGSLAYQNGRPGNGAIIGGYAIDRILTYVPGDAVFHPPPLLDTK